MQSQKNPIRTNFTPIGCAIVLAILGVTLLGCNRQPPAPVKTANLNTATAEAVLTKVGKLAEDSIYSCLLNAYAQGRSPAQARDECVTKLLEDDKKGFGGSIGNLRPGSDSFFDPSKITAACNTGDPTRGQTSGSHTTPGWEKNTWGIDVPVPLGTAPKGLKMEESDKLKADRITAAKAEWEKYYALLDDEIAAEKALETAKKTGDQQQIQAAQKDLKDAKKATAVQGRKALETSEEATKDPNIAGTVRTGGEPSACDQALDGARELLRECHRTNWKDFRCQQLQARVSGCPDPALILVDPDQGYVCGAKVDPETVRKAWVAKCEQRVKFGPDTANPCSPPTLDSSSRFGRGGKMGDICGNPYAQTDPNNDECSIVTIGGQFGQINIQEIILIGLNGLGGPIIVIPTDPRPGK